MPLRSLSVFTKSSPLTPCIKILQSNNHPLFVSCSSSSGSCLANAKKFAESLNLPFVSFPVTVQGFSLIFTDTRLELRENSVTKKTSGHPLYVDFVGGKNGYRHMHNSTIHQPLARAVGIRPGFRPTVIDATAGLGRDGFVLACLGCNVTLVERSQILGALLQDGLQRGMRHSLTAKIIRERISLIVADSKEVISACLPKPFSIYLDPMYPKREKSALNKKEMRMLRLLVGDDLDGPSLLYCALQCAENRVVVKRPKKAPMLAECPPSHHILMKNSRFDIYLVSSR